MENNDFFHEKQWHYVNKLAFKGLKSYKIIAFLVVMIRMDAGKNIYVTESGKKINI